LGIKSLGFGLWISDLSSDLYFFSCQSQKTKTKIKDKVDSAPKRAQHGCEEDPVIDQ